MSLGQRQPVRMDLAAFALGEVEQIRPGVFRHPATLGALLARLALAATRVMSGALRQRSNARGEGL